MWLRCSLGKLASPGYSILPFDVSCTLEYSLSYEFLLTSSSLPPPLSSLPPSLPLSLPPPTHPPLSPSLPLVYTDSPPSVQTVDPPRVLSQEVSVSRLYGTFSTYRFTEETGCSYTRSRWFKRIEPPRTVANHLATHRVLSAMESTCPCTQVLFGVVPLYRTFSTYLFTGETRFSGCSCTLSGWFKRIEPPRTFSNHSRESSRESCRWRRFGRIEPP